MIDWLQAGELPGLTVAGCRLPSPGGIRKVLRTGLDADLVVFTPRTCLVIDVEMPTEPMTGDMQCPAAEPWRMAGIAGDPIEVRLRDTNPLDRLTETTEAVGAALGEQDSALEVLGLLVVVPFAGVPITLNVDREGLPAGTDVLLAEHPHQLNERLAAVDRVRPVAWTVGRVREALDVLVGEQHGLTDEQLGALGFPGAGAESPPPAAVPPAAGVAGPIATATAVPPASGTGPGAPVPGSAHPPASGAAPDAAVPDPVAPPVARTAPAPDDSARRTTGPAQAAETPPPPGGPLPSVARRRSPLISLLLATLALIAFGTALWLFSRCAAADDAAPLDSTPLPVQTVADRPEPVPAPPPAPSIPTCYPFQSGC
ncbi:hypothetical protein [Nocardia sp. NPDC057353]|uniref:hypothetical protein n=1 Tax=Nocardia sp. NPDC057353 TaxID=3346104 RepID=UPI00362FD56C